MLEGTQGKRYDDFIKNYISSDKKGSNGLELRRKKVQDYDFTKPKKFTKEQLKFLSNIYEVFSRYLASYLSTSIRTLAQVTLEEIEEQSFVEYAMSLQEKVLTGAVKLKPIEGTIIVEISNDLTFSLIERLLGGSGNSKPLDRECTEIEVAVMENLLKKIAELSETAWSNQMKTEATLNRVETNTRYVQSLTDADTVLVISLAVDISGTGGKIRMCLPCDNLESIVAQASTTHVSKKIDPKEAEKSKDAVMGHLQETQFVVKGILSEKEITMKDVMNLQVGDVIRLDASVESKAFLKVDDKVLFHGIQGLKNNKKAFRISEVL